MLLPFRFEDGLCMYAVNITPIFGHMHTHLESLRVDSDLAVWFIVEQSIPKYQGEVGVNVQSIFIAILLNASLDVI